MVAVSDDLDVAMARENYLHAVKDVFALSRSVEITNGRQQGVHLD